MLEKEYSGSILACYAEGSLLMQAYLFKKYPQSITHVNGIDKYYHFFLNKLVFQESKGVK